MNRPLLAKTVAMLLLLASAGADSAAGEAPAATAAVTATATPSPVPLGAVAPPTVGTTGHFTALSIPECQALIRRAESELPDQNSITLDDETVARLRTMVDSSARYLNYRNDLHTSLAHYNWINLATGNVENDPGTFDHDTISFQRPVESISALSIEASRGDLWLHRLVIFDEKNMKRQEFDFSTHPRLLRHGLPRRDVYHLWRRTTISRIEIEYSRANPGPPTAPSPVAVIQGGISTSLRPEYIKTAIYQLNEASSQIAARDWVAARRSLVDANQRIDDFVRKNKPR